MAIATYTLADYIQDLRTVTSETQDPNEIIARVGPLAERAALSRDWLRPHHYECDSEQGFGVHLLHEEPDHTLAVFAIAWTSRKAGRARHRSNQPSTRGHCAINALAPRTQASTEATQISATVKRSPAS